MKSLYTLNHDLNVFKRDLERIQSDAEDKQEEIDNFDKSEYLTEERYDDMLNDCSPDIEIGNISFQASRVLYECDPIAYNCGFSDYADSLENESFTEYNDLMDELTDLENEISDHESDIEMLEDEITELEDQQDED